MIRRDYAFGGQSTFWYSTEYDLLGRPTNATDSVSLVREWLYNRRSELAAASIGTNLYGYAYDSIGNRLWSAENAATNTYTANSLNQYTSVAASTNLVYDADGNLTNDGIFSYSYDAENRLVAAYPLSPVVGSLAVLNRYDHKHRRVQKIVKQYNGTTWETAETHTFVWDGNNIVLEKVAFADGTTRMCEYFWGMDKSGTEQGAGGVGGLLAVSVDGVFYIPCYDHNGNIVSYVSEAGSIAAQYTYDPYGNTVEYSGPLADVFSFSFSTKYHDRVIGMICYQERVYSPVLGRWLNRDPIGEWDCLNLYCSFYNCPTFITDPLGKTVFVVTDSTPSRKTSITLKRGDKIVYPRGVTRITGSVTFSCDKRCVLHAKGVIQLWIELLNEDDPRWDKRYSQYLSSTNDREDLNTLSHEMDHFSTWSAFLDFVKTANDLDGKQYSDCKERAARYNAAYHKFRAMTAAHSLKFDDDGWNMGGQYPRHPLDTSSFKWE